MSSTGLSRRSKRFPVSRSLRLGSPAPSTDAPLADEPEGLRQSGASIAISPHGRARKQALAILDGPRSISRPALAGESFWGWPTLTLQVRSAAISPRIEVRSVYANLVNTVQQVAVLRAVSFDAGPLAKAVQSPDFRLALPARFVQVGADELRGWLGRFDDVTVRVQEGWEDDGEHGVLRRLRIERDYVAAVFEKIWLAREGDKTLLDQRWEEVWELMTAVLKSSPTVSAPEEDFSKRDPHPVVYDLDAYRPG